MGTIKHPKYDFICGSPDGLIEKDGGMELKSHISYREYLKSERKMPSKHKPQVQGYLWITDRMWWDFVSFYSKNGKTLIHIHRVEPVKAYHELLEAKCLEFWKKVDEL